MAKTKQFLIAALLTGSESGANGAVLRHTLEANDSPFDVETQHACLTYVNQPSPHWCNPALFPFTKEAAIKGDIALNADRDAYDTTDRFLNEPIDKEFVEELFREKDFQSFSGATRLEAVSSYLSFSYIPVYVVGAYQLSNPNLPEVAAAGSRESQVRMTSGRTIATLGPYQVHAGASIAAFDRMVYYVQANALELVVKDIDDLLEVDRQRGANLDAGLALTAAEGPLPNVSLVGENLFLSQEDERGERRLLDLEPLYRRRLRLGVGKTWMHDTGSYFLGLHLPFWDAAQSFDRYGASVAFIYGIGRLRAFTSFSPLMIAFGFLFMGEHYHVGIQYTDDKQDNSLDLRRHRNTYLFTSFNF